MTDQFISGRGFSSSAGDSSQSSMARLKALRLMQVSVAFVVLYSASNYLTGLRNDVGEGVFGWERAIPFVEISIFPYLSIFALFGASFFLCRGGQELERHCARLLLALLISVFCYAAFPLRFDFVRPEPIGATGAVFRWLWAVDLPFNRAPSLHISVLVILWARFVVLLPPASKTLLHVWMVAIAVSVLTTYQHHVIDVLSGLLVGATCLAVPSSWLERLRSFVSNGTSGHPRLQPARGPADAWNPGELSPRATTSAQEARMCSGVVVGSHEKRRFARPSQRMASRNDAQTSK